MCAGGVLSTHFSKFHHACCMLTFLCCAHPSTAELIRHEDHFDRVPVWDATRSNGWENHNHYSGGYGGHGHGRWLKSETTQENKTEPQNDNTPQESTPVAGDKVEGGNSRNLLGTQEWGTGAFWYPPIQPHLFGQHCSDSYQPWGPQ
jgi:hypothetical protein